MFYKRVFYYIFFIVLIIVFQIYKKIEYQTEEEKISKAKIMSNSEYVKLLDQLPVYRDSVFSIYIANFYDKNKIIYFKKDSITLLEANSKFFLHLYPKNKKLLNQVNSTNISYDFRSNFKSFKYMEKTYFYSEIDLPDFIIEKINTGQYGYNQNNSISWQIKHVLRGEYIKGVLGENGEISFSF